MNLPWKGGRAALIAASASDRKFKIFLCFISTIGMAAFALVNPLVVRFTIDSVIGTAPPSIPSFVSNYIDLIGGMSILRQNFWICAVVIALLALFSEVFNGIRNYTAVEIGERMSWRLRNTLYSHIQKLSWDWHVGCQTGDIIQRCTTDVDHIRNFVQYNISEMLRTFCVFIIALIMMFSMDVFMSLVSLSLIPLILVFSTIYFGKVSKNFALAESAEGAMQACAQENYTGVRVVRAFGREVYERNKFADRTLTYATIWLRIAKMLGTFWSVSDLFCGFQMAVIIAAGVWRCVGGHLTPGSFIAFYSYCHWMIWPIRELGRILSELSKTSVASGRIKEILEAEPEMDPPDALYPEIKGEICFDKVNFTYPTASDTKASQTAIEQNNKSLTPVLRDISFTLKPGETMAILGATGSGKSSLVHLLARLYDLPEGNGAITIDGIDIRKIARSHLRKHIGLCLQEPFLFSKTIKENITVAKDDLEMSEIRSATSVAMVHDTIEKFADGYNTVIGERGVTLSGGQKQRLSIARMLASNAPVMIFDDSLSAVDTETDAKIRAALKQRVKDAAVIIISHRISTLMQADKILVLKNGSVEDIGSHHELLQRPAPTGCDGTYKRIFDMQASGLEE